MKKKKQTKNQNQTPPPPQISTYCEQSMCGSWSTNFRSQFTPPNLLWPYRCFGIPLFTLSTTRPVPACTCLHPACTPPAPHLHLTYICLHPPAPCLHPACTPSSPHLLPTCTLQHQDLGSKCVYILGQIFLFKGDVILCYVLTFSHNWTLGYFVTKERLISKFLRTFATNEHVSGVKSHEPAS